jgi:hypothetical protein
MGTKVVTKRIIFDRGIEVEQKKAAGGLTSVLSYEDQDVGFAALTNWFTKCHSKLWILSTYFSFYFQSKI